MTDEELTKRQFMAKHGFWPHEERCVCGWRRADHSVWNCADNFRGTGKKG